MKPIIGVMPLWDEEKDSYWMLPGYLEGIREAGGLPIMMPLTDEAEEAEQLLDLCDGLLFTGGQDVDPALYGESEAEELGELCPDRDRMELLFMQMALQREIPVLGICRGLQFLNVFFGGTLYQDLPAQHPSAVRHSMAKPYDGTAHRVSLVTGSPLADLILSGDPVRSADETSGTKAPVELAVNSCHHQAIRDLAPGLEAMAISEDGLIESIRKPDYPFLWAVQWHPEFTYKNDANSRRIFRAFLDAARNH